MVVVVVLVQARVLDEETLVLVQAHVLGYLENYSLAPFTCYIIALLHTWRQ